MTKHLLVPVLVCLSVLGFSQNLDFENWSSSSVLYLDDYETMTHNNAMYGQQAVMQSTDVVEGSYSIRLETVMSGEGDLVFGYFTSGDPETYEGGQAVSLNAIDSIVGYYKYDVMSDDTALFLCVAKFMGVPTGGNIYSITGTQSTWQRFSYPIMASSVDSVIVAAASSNAINQIGIAEGSWIMFDDIQLKSNTNGLEPVNNSGFENWTTQLWEDLDEWTTANSYVVNLPTLPCSKTTDAYSGTYASQLETIETPDGDQIEGFMSYGQYTENGPLGGFPYSDLPESVRFYYKTNLQADDTAFASIIFKKNGTPIDYKGGYILQSESTYTLWEMPVNLPEAPDTVFLAFSVGESIGAQFIVDAFEFVLPVAVAEHFNVSEVVAFPNPAQDILKFEFDGLKQAFEIQIFNSIGQQVKQIEVSTHKNTYLMDISNLKAGQYYYQIELEGELYTKQFIKQ